MDEPDGSDSSGFISSSHTTDLYSARDVSVDEGVQSWATLSPTSLAEFHSIMSDDFFSFEDSSSLNSFHSDNEDFEKQVNMKIKVLIMNHAEPIDDVFPFWIERNFRRRRYRRNDLNLPITIPQREQPLSSYLRDPPITNVGRYQATLCGEALALRRESFEYAFCSPALRCIQTCDAVLRALGIRDTVPIKIEPGLMEYLANPMFREGLPRFMEREELLAADYNIDGTYQPCLTLVRLRNYLHENMFSHYARKSATMSNILRFVEKKGGGRILLVGHSTTLDACTRELLRDRESQERQELNELIPTNPFQEMIEITRRVKYCSTILLQGINGDWKLHRGPLHCVTHLDNAYFNYRVLTGRYSNNP